MNSCILMARIVQTPQIRYTADQTPIAEMMVEFDSWRSEEPPSTLKVVGWRNTATEIQENYQAGDLVVIEGRLGMRLLEREDRGERFKEKRAELTASRLHKIGNQPLPTAAVSQPSNVVPIGNYNKPPAPESQPADLGNPPAPEPAPAPPSSASPPDDRDLDEIPF